MCLSFLCLKKPESQVKSRLHVIFDEFENTDDVSRFLAKRQMMCLGLLCGNHAARPFNIMLISVNLWQSKIKSQKTPKK